MEGRTNGSSFTFGIVEKIGFDRLTCNPALQSNFEAFTCSVDMYSGPGVIMLRSLFWFHRHIKTCTTGFSGRKFLNMVLSGK
jgi:hypothetical protein